MQFQHSATPNQMATVSKEYITLHFECLEHKLGKYILPNHDKKA